MGVAVKICGLSTSETLEAALAAGADMVGFVRCERSPRHISLDVARKLGQQASGRARKVLLTVDADDEALAASIAALGPDMVQLHGAESPDRVRAVRARFSLPVIKAVAIAGKADLAAIPAYEGVAGMLLLDSRPAGQSPGGTGVAFDWTLLEGLHLHTPWLLAGGLTPANVGAALAATGAPGVDVSSGVESAPGTKDVAKIARFIANVRAAAEKLGSTVESR